MPRVSGDRFSSQNMSDCDFCPAEGRRFRTMRQCSGCGKYLCLVCRPQVPAAAVLCPECGGGACENALQQPGAAILRLTEAGHTAPFWLLMVEERLALVATKDPDEIIVPE
jgi:hypothetical protein